MYNKRRITVTEICNSPGHQWVATYHDGEGAGWGLSGSTAVEAEAKLRDAYRFDCEGLTAIVEPADKLTPIKETAWAKDTKRSADITDELRILFDNYTDALARVKADLAEAKAGGEK